MSLPIKRPMMVCRRWRLASIIHCTIVVQAHAKWLAAKPADNLAHTLESAGLMGRLSRKTEPQSVLASPTGFRLRAVASRIQASGHLLCSTSGSSLSALHLTLYHSCFHRAAPRSLPESSTPESSQEIPQNSRAKRTSNRTSQDSRAPKAPKEKASMQGSYPARSERFSKAYDELRSDAVTSVMLVGTAWMGFEEFGRGAIYANNDEGSDMYAPLDFWKSWDTDKEESSSMAFVKKDAIQYIKDYDPIIEVVIVFQSEGMMSVNKLRPNVAPPEVAQMPQFKARYNQLAQTIQDEPDEPDEPDDEEKKKIIMAEANRALQKEIDATQTELDKLEDTSSTELESRGYGMHGQHAIPLLFAFASSLLLLGLNKFRSWRKSMRVLQAPLTWI
eukprot:gnl/TRDRNA2_/TRDRNA2_41222_c0_seq1.p1 gnl/TRDRNA2_/TRDRNA2_41222_c0~~gnl/TRDRNA2_/TRDRNA2_41222_c0_seq1.p1  ORF type:complete len:389 (-),score=48.11 gnl/TRDRNA2_/TRDRNA2_41222_c0_seq1:7-1173(-)